VLIAIYVTGRRRHRRPNKVYIFLISINSRVNMCVCPSGYLSFAKNNHIHSFEGNTVFMVFNVIY